MAITTLSSREFNQDTNKAKKATEHGPVFITHRGKPSHVLLSIEQYQKLVGPTTSIIELLSMPGAEDVELETPRLGDIAQPADLG